MRALLPHLALVSTLGCGSAAYTYSGYWASNHFPIEDNWVWEYTNEGEDFLLRAETTNREASGATEIVTIDYSNRETGNLLYSSSGRLTRPMAFRSMGTTSRSRSPVQTMTAVTMKTPAAQST